MNMPRTKLIPNGNNIDHTFSDAEYICRQTCLRKHMAANNIDAVIFTSIHCINYYSDFLYCSFGRPYALVLTHDKATTVSANIDGGQPWRRTFGENLVYTDWQKDSFFYALQQL
ncbi:MAG: aminopeptidase P family N-terminal domain-containing protein, partial [Gammaproteobacteria bacterium]|nr:aminopeptidase P family N-terminal domain-containing protein [Gammaproteobacteria bacterium]